MMSLSRDPRPLPLLFSFKRVALASLRALVAAAIRDMIAVDQIIGSGGPFPIEVVDYAPAQARYVSARIDLARPVSECFGLLQGAKLTYQAGGAPVWTQDADCVARHITLTTATRIRSGVVGRRASTERLVIEDFSPLAPGASRTG